MQALCNTSDQRFKVYQSPANAQKQQNNKNNIKIYNKMLF
jgi:hypothetical protein